MKVSLRIPIDTAAMQTDPKAIGKGYTVVDTGDSRDLSRGAMGYIALIFAIQAQSLVETRKLNYRTSESSLKG